MATYMSILNKTAGVTAIVGEITLDVQEGDVYMSTFHRTVEYCTAWWRIFQYCTVQTTGLTSIVGDSAVIRVECIRLAGDKLRDVGVEVGEDGQPHRALEGPLGRVLLSPHLQIFRRHFQTLTLLQCLCRGFKNKELKICKNIVHSNLTFVYSLKIVFVLY